jgi:hypothetical protein
MSAATWSDLDTELDAWQAAGLVATLWWRDDDAGDVTPPLHRLIELASLTGTPLALAVIPERCSTLLPRALGRAPATVLQHGYAHANRADRSAKKSEFGADRPLAQVRAELTMGRRLLERAFPGRFLPVLVPPWNRIAAPVCALLGPLGYLGLSTYGPRAAAAADGVRVVNTHVDIIDWRGSRGFVGADAALAALIGHLAARRAGAADADEPTGVLSHHLDHDRGCWAFLEALFSRSAGHPAARWLDAGSAFGATPAGAEGSP